MFKITMRTYIPIVFLPTELWLPKSATQFYFMRKQHEFQRVSGGSSINRSGKSSGKLKSVFSKKPKATYTSSGIRFRLEVRMLYPVILVSHEPIPVEFILSSDRQIAGSIYMRSLEIRIVSITRVAAQSHEKEIIRFDS